MQFLMSKSELAEAFNVAPKTVDGWVRRGCPVQERGARGVAYKLALTDVLNWMIERDSEKGDDLKLNLEKAGLIREQRRLAKMRADAMARSLIPVDEVTTTWSNVMANARQLLLALPSKLANKAMSATTLREVEDFIRAEIHAALTELGTADLSQPPKDRQ